MGLHTSDELQDADVIDLTRDASGQYRPAPVVVTPDSLTGAKVTGQNMHEPGKAADPDALKTEIEAARVALGYEGKTWDGIVKEQAGVSLGYADAEQLTKLRDYLVALAPK
jgi:hypothetical protein